MDLIIEDHFKTNLKDRFKIDFTDLFKNKLIEILTDIEYDKIITRHNKKLYVETLICSQRVLLILIIQKNKTYRLITIIPAKEHDAIKKINKKYSLNNYGKIIFNLNKRINKISLKNKCLNEEMMSINLMLKKINSMSFKERLLFILTGKITEKNFNKGV